MNRFVMLICVGLVTVVSAATLVHAQATTQPVDLQQMQQRLQDLESQVTDLRARISSTQPATAERQNATQPPGGPGEGLTAGYSVDKGFYIRAGNGAFLLHPWAFIQARDAYDYRSIDTTNAHDGENGLELPRAKLLLDGNIFSEDLTFQMIWNSTDTTGNLQLQDCWGRYHFPGTVLAVEGGQIRDPVDHEQILFATKTLTPDRSIVNNVLLNGDDIVKGVMLSAGYDNPSSLRGELAFTGGQRNFDTTFQTYPTNPASWGVSGRAEYKWMGDWEDYNQITALADKHPLLVFGVGADYTEGGATAGLTHVLDAQYNFPDGLTLYAAYLGRYVRHDAGNPTTDGEPATASATYASTDTYDATARFMAAYIFKQHFEPFFRYEYLHFDAAEFTAPTNNDFSDISLGFNYYFHGHRAKFTGAASYLPQGSPVANTISDLLATHRGQELLIQGQVQLIF